MYSCVFNIMVYSEQQEKIYLNMTKIEHVDLKGW